MPYTKEHKARTRATILERASEAFREGGVAGVSIPKIMARAELTHGGFYAHFDSKAALLAEASRRALEETTERLAAVAASVEPEARLKAVVETYVSAAHRDHPERGCVVPALAGELSRQPEEVGAAFTEAFHAFAKMLAGLLPEERSEDDAFALAAGLVGAILTARAVADPELSDRILASSRRNLIEAYSGEEPGESRGA